MLAVLSLSLSACRCGPKVQPVEPPRLVLTPQRLSLGTVYVRQVATGVVSAVNEGGAPVEADVVVEAPFTVEPGRLRLVRGEATQVTVSFAPLQPGLVSGVLLVGDIQVQVEAEALEVPACVATTVCTEARFDVAGAQCVESTRANGAACETSCVTGACSAGTCVGQLKGCDDANACTVDACDEAAGCSHTPRVCPEPTNPCQVAGCDLATGCTTEPAVDGTLCGPDDCLATQVNVCITGACVTRQRPATARCSNTWVPATPLSGDWPVAYDEARRRTVMLQGDETWTWDGLRWTFVQPVTSPPIRGWHAMTYDSVRKRVVMFGGRHVDSAFNETLLNDTWEWDGTTWTQRFPIHVPPPQFHHSLAYDSVRRRTVLFGGANRGSPMGRATWEWDGVDWVEKDPRSPAPWVTQAAMAYDPAHQRVVLFGGDDGNGRADASTWTWDGISWLRMSPASSPRAGLGFSMAFDSARQRIVLAVTPAAVSPPTGTETWEWDGTTWTQRNPALAPPSRSWAHMTYDVARDRMVLFGGRSWDYLGDTWEWNGTTWFLRTEAPLITNSRSAAVFDSTRREVLLVADDGFNTSIWHWNGEWRSEMPFHHPGDYSAKFAAFDRARSTVVVSSIDAKTWEWDGAWHFRAVSVGAAPITFDDARHQVVLLDGSTTMPRDTWTWNGSAWGQLFPPTSPLVSDALTYDSHRQRVVSFGGYLSGFGPNTVCSNATWEWDGTTWLERTPAVSPPTSCYGGNLAFDVTRQRVMLVRTVYVGAQRDSELWEWDGTTWLQRMPTRSMGGSALTYDEERQKLTLWGDDRRLWVFLP
jgi:hypothetical protein